MSETSLPDYKQLKYSEIVPGKDGARIFDAGTIVLVIKHLPKSKVSVSPSDGQGKPEDFQFEVMLADLDEVTDTDPKRKEFYAV